MRRRGSCLGLTLAAVLAGCAAAPREPPPLAVPAVARTVEETILYAPTTWSGTVRLVKPLVVTKTATLTLLPGTTVFLEVPAPDKESDRRPWLLVLGSIVAMGTAEQPISFRSVEARRNELDDIVQVQKAREAHFRHCTFERGPWALHIHETDADVIACVFRDNYGGVRFQGDRVVLRGNRFEGNTLGVRCLRASPVLEENAFVGNATGIFFREGVERAVVRRNNFDNVEYDVKLGESQSADVDAAQNWWAPRRGGAAGERIYDGADSPGLGLVLVAPPLLAPWGQEAKAK